MEKKSDIKECPVYIEDLDLLYCSICMQNDKEIVETGCKNVHQICKECLDKIKKKNNICPFCREELGIIMLRIIYDDLPDAIMKINTDEKPSATKKLQFSLSSMEGIRKEGDMLIWDVRKVPNEQKINVVGNIQVIQKNFMAVQAEYRQIQNYMNQIHAASDNNEMLSRRFAEALAFR